MKEAQDTKVPGLEKLDQLSKKIAGIDKEIKGVAKIFSQHRDQSTEFWQAFIEKFQKHKHSKIGRYRKELDIALCLLKMPLFKNSDTEKKQIRLLLINLTADYLVSIRFFGVFDDVSSPSVNLNNLADEFGISISEEDNASLMDASFKLARQKFFNRKYNTVNEFCEFIKEYDQCLTEENIALNLDFFHQGNSRGESVLYVAVHENKSKTVRFLLNVAKSKMSLSEYAQWINYSSVNCHAPLYESFYLENYELFEMLLNAGADPKADFDFDCTILDEIVYSLIDSGFKPLSGKYIHGNEEIELDDQEKIFSLLRMRKYQFQYIIEDFCKIDLKICSDFIQSVFDREIDTINNFLLANPDIILINSYGKTVLHHIADDDNYSEVLAKLVYHLKSIGKIAVINSENMDGQTVADIAICNDAFKNLTCLLKAGAEFNDADIGYLKSRISDVNERGDMELASLLQSIIDNSSDNSGEPPAKKRRLASSKLSSSPMHSTNINAFINRIRNTNDTLSLSEFRNNANLFNVEGQHANYVLHTVAEKGDVQSMENLILVAQEKITGNEFDDWITKIRGYDNAYESALLVSVNNENYEMFAILLNNRASPSVYCNNEQTILEILVEKLKNDQILPFGNMKEHKKPIARMMLLLKDKYIDKLEYDFDNIDFLDRNSCKMFIDAIWQRSLSLVKEVIQAYPGITKIKCYGYTPHDIAKQSGCSEEILNLLKPVRTPCKFYQQPSDVISGSADLPLPSSALLSLLMPPAVSASLAGFDAKSGESVAPFLETKRLFYQAAPAARPKSNLEEAMQARNFDQVKTLLSQGAKTDDIQQKILVAFANAAVDTGKFEFIALMDAARSQKLSDRPSAKRRRLEAPVINPESSAGDGVFRAVDPFTDEVPAFTDSSANSPQLLQIMPSKELPRTTSEFFKRAEDPNMPSAMEDDETCAPSP